MDTNPQTTPTSPTKTGEINSFWILGARLTWTLIGPIALLGITYGIATSDSGWLTGLDIAFVAVAGLMVLGRWVEQRSGTAMTLTGEPATPEQAQRYTNILLPVSAAGWGTANIVGNYLIN